MIDIAFNSLMIIGGREARKRGRDPPTSGTREKNY